jgi:multicomponent Na+:H+ antiporter subunit C
VDPLPQALVLTSIVIGLGITALLVAMALRLHEKYGTFDVEAMRKLRG